MVRPIAAPTWNKWWTGSQATCDEQIRDFEFARAQASLKSTTGSTIALAESAYRLAELLHAAGDDRAVDYWARTIAWTDVAAKATADCRCRSIRPSQCSACEYGSCRTVRVRQSAIIRTITCGPGYGRLDPSSHLLINGSTQTYVIPIAHQGFAWNKDDFDRLLVFEPPRDAPGNVSGQGVPLVVLTPDRTRVQSTKLANGLRNEDNPCGEDQCHTNQCSSEQCGDPCATFLTSEIPFAATALLNLPASLFDSSQARSVSNGEPANAASFTFVNPLALDATGGSGRIAQSPAMPLIYARQHSQYNPLAAFLSGDNGIDEPRLVFLEPYQAGKTPLILVHGLLSNPAAFLDVADVVRADPVLRSRYQIWVFRYPTGDDFLESAAALRQQLATAFACRHQASPTQVKNPLNDPTQQAVVVGHSMGGLVAKLQVTDSGDRLWRAISNVPLEQLRGPPATLANFRRSFFFRANPHIGRIVYIATPHQGSPWASTGIGRLGAGLARSGTRERADFEAIRTDNPGALKGGFDESFPSSVDLLRPDSSLLLRLSYTASAQGVRVHSIVGNLCRLPRAGPSDGVVPMDSAFRSEAESTAVVDATHTLILRSPEAQQELLRILRLHLERHTLNKNLLPRLLPWPQAIWPPTISISWSACHPQPFFQSFQ